MELHCSGFLLPVVLEESIIRKQVVVEESDVWLFESIWPISLLLVNVV